MAAIIENHFLLFQTLKCFTVFDSQASVWNSKISCSLSRLTAFIRPNYWELHCQGWVSWRYGVRGENYWRLWKEQSRYLQLWDASIWSLKKVLKFLIPITRKKLVTYNLIQNSTFIWRKVPASSSLSWTTMAGSSYL